MRHERHLIRFTPAHIKPVTVADKLGLTSPPVYMCPHCLAVRVPAKSTPCRPCIQIVANRLAADAERYELRRFAAKAVVASAIGVGLIAALWFVAAGY